MGLNPLTYDIYAYTNGIKDLHPGVKLLFALGNLLLALVSPTMGFSLLLLLLVSLVSLGPARIPARVYLTLMAVPLLFLLLGSTALFLGVSKGSQDFSSAFSLGGWFVGVVPGQLPRVGEVVSRSLAAVACLNFLILTTPFVDLLEVFKGLRLPGILLDLIFLVYRSIFVTLGMASQIHLAQEVRLGYQGLFRTRRSIAVLAGSLGIKTFQRSRQMAKALESRACSGELAVLAPLRPLNRGHFIAVAALEGALALLGWYGWR